MEDTIKKLKNEKSNIILVLDQYENGCGEISDGILQDKFIVFLKPLPSGRGYRNTNHLIN